MQTLRLFFDVARCHSFSRAAELHGLTQSAVSQRINGLEKRLGTRLIDRSVRPLGLTPAGEYYLTGVEDILARHDALEQRVAQLNDGELSAVRVGAIYSAGIDLLARVRTAYLVEHPKATIDIVFHHPETVVQMVLDHELDFGIVSFPEGWRKTVAIPLREENMAVVVAPDHELATRERFTPADLDNVPLLAFDNRLPVARKIRAYLRDHGVHVVVSQSFDNLDTLKSAVMSSSGIAILPAQAVAREADAGLLRVIPLQPSLTRPIGIIHRPSNRPGAGLSPAARHFSEFLCQHARTTDNAGVLGAPS
ncbi:LysR family transcriptional regulator [Mucisphaera calidilacus]|uniref:HTH-type transcriptional regulator GltC n=1 Tax=Mucisphaera calidilacus TaxID=2527982 RepID=A0A518C134_9BACT|nr:LysR family transcriptional regulator [Mucisphaera calidilacus]QDU72920.1 HTH-type transcriptional regulator GltC [Mucisphaera calidilacus]